MPSDGSEKTERPTPRRLREARRKGQIPLGRDLASALSFAACVGVLVVTTPRLASAARASVVDAIEHACGADGFHAAAAIGRLDEALAGVLWGSLPAACAALAVGTLACVLQTGGAVTASALAAKPERLDPLAGLKRLVRLRTLVELGKTWAKIAVVAAAVLTAAIDRRGALAGALAQGGEPAFALAFDVVSAAATRAAAVLVLLGAADVLVQRRLHERELRMSKEEVRRDHKEDEGDPHVKSARRQAHREIATQRMIDAARSASFVAVNPTHVATAVRYDEAGDEAPRVVAKGSGEVARRIRRAAEECGVEVVRDRPLARALYRVPLDAEIPETLYAAVAEVLAYLRTMDTHARK